MAKVGYIFMAATNNCLDTDKVWMQQYGCINIVEEQVEHEKLRPQWKQLVASLTRGDELVISKFSNAVRGVRELSTFLEMCRIKVVRVISLQDKLDTKGELFPETTAASVLEMIGSLPEEVAVLRKAGAHILHLKSNIKLPPKVVTNQTKDERERIIVAMYNGNHSIDDIWQISGFKSRSSVFRILNKYNVDLNRGKFKGPLGKRKPKDTDATLQDE